MRNASSTLARWLRFGNEGSESVRIREIGLWETMSLQFYGNRGADSEARETILIMAQDYNPHRYRTAQSVRLKGYANPCNSDRVSKFMAIVARMVKMLKMH